jgi:hypothetical protein
MSYQSTSRPRKKLKLFVNTFIYYCTLIEVFLLLCRTRVEENVQKRDTVSTRHTSLITFPCIKNTMSLETINRSLLKTACEETSPTLWYKNFF